MKTNKKITFIIPAAGKSSRFKGKKSKIFYQINKKEILKHIIEKIYNYSKKIFIISSKKNYLEIKKIIKEYDHKKINIIIQNKIDGMATAVLLGIKKADTKNTGIIWADQIGITKKTIVKTINAHKNFNSCITLPIVQNLNPYTKVIIRKKQIIKIVQKREDRFKEKKCFSDCGLFICNTYKIKKKLPVLIKNKQILTRKTKEHDFLKSFEFFAKNEKINFVNANSSKEAIGINKLSDIKKYKL
tara:strand:- start:401 stop:1132 length:732 start_codon:yes stop_codon:yes gene_type:complete